MRLPIAATTEKSSEVKREKKGGTWKAAKRVRSNFFDRFYCGAVKEENQMLPT